MTEQFLSSGKVTSFHKENVSNVWEDPIAASQHWTRKTSSVCIPLLDVPCLQVWKQQGLWGQYTTTPVIQCVSVGANLTDWHNPPQSWYYFCYRQAHVLVAGSRWENHHQLKSWDHVQQFPHCEKLHKKKQNKKIFLKTFKKKTALKTLD